MASSLVDVLLYDDCQTDTWISNAGPSINPVDSDSYKPYNTPGGLWVVNTANKEMGGALVSRSYAYVPGMTHFGMDITYFVSSLDMPHLARNEMDLKITVKPGTSANQANGSVQQNASRNWMWQLDPTGQTWVDSGFEAGPPIPDQLNTVKFRFWSDGTRWSVLGINFNGREFIPGSKFQYLPMITTNWSPGLHPQLQTEVQNAPWSLRQRYSKIRLWQSKHPIPWI